MLETAAVTHDSGGQPPEIDFSDNLTGLAHPAFFQGVLALAHAQHRRVPARSFAVIALGVDDFDEVEQALGAAGSRQMLQLIAARLRASLRTTDTVSHFGQARFGILLSDTDDAGDAVIPMQRLQQCLPRTVDLEGHRMVISIRMGAALSTPRHDVPSAVLNDATLAMLSARHSRPL